jgi:hypothetical protein
VFKYNRDQNGGNPLGLGWLQFTIKGGERSSAATSYLREEVRGRKNLDIVLGTKVGKVFENGGGKGVWKGVEFIGSDGGYFLDSIFES